MKIAYDCLNFSLKLLRINFILIIVLQIIKQLLLHESSRHLYNIDSDFIRNKSILTNFDNENDHQHNLNHFSAPSSSSLNNYKSFSFSSSSSSLTNEKNENNNNNNRIESSSRVSDILSSWYSSWYEVKQLEATKTEILNVVTSFRRNSSQNDADAENSNNNNRSSSSSSTETLNNNDDNAATKRATLNNGPVLITTSFITFNEILELNDFKNFIKFAILLNLNFTCILVNLLIVSYLIIRNHENSNDFFTTQDDRSSPPRKSSFDNGDAELGDCTTTTTDCNHQSLHLSSSSNNTRKYVSTTNNCWSRVYLKLNLNLNIILFVVILIINTIYLLIINGYYNSLIKFGSFNWLNDVINRQFKDEIGEKLNNNNLNIERELIDFKETTTNGVVSYVNLNGFFQFILVGNAKLNVFFMVLSLTLLFIYAYMIRIDTVNGDDDDDDEEEEEEEHEEKSSEKKPCLIKTTTTAAEIIDLNKAKCEKLEKKADVNIQWIIHSLLIIYLLSVWDIADVYKYFRLKEAQSFDLNSYLSDLNTNQLNRNLLINLNLNQFNYGNSVNFDTISSMVDRDALENYVKSAINLDDVSSYTNGDGDDDDDEGLELDDDDKDYNDYNDQTTRSNYLANLFILNKQNYDYINMKQIRDLLISRKNELLRNPDPNFLYVKKHKKYKYDFDSSQVKHLLNYENNMEYSDNGVRFLNEPLSASASSESKSSSSSSLTILNQNVKSVTKIKVLYILKRNTQLFGDLMVILFACLVLHKLDSFKPLKAIYKHSPLALTGRGNRYQFSSTCRYLTTDQLTKKIQNL